MRHRAIGRFGGGGGVGRSGDSRTIRSRARSTDGASARWRAPFSHRGNAPGPTRREDPINTATTSAADSTTTSRDAEFDAATVRSLVHIRELGPGDGDVVDVVFAGLSPRSRYLRFQGPVAELSAATRRSLTALDGRTHVALAAFTQGRPIGIVRIIDLGDGRGELAVEVVDRWQGCGVGTRLLQAARDRAAEHGLPRARRRDARGERSRPRGPSPRLPPPCGCVAMVRS